MALIALLHSVQRQRPRTQARVRAAYGAVEIPEIVQREHGALAGTVR